MNDREALYRLLYEALVEIREEAYNTSNKKIFYLADLLHTLPLQLEHALREGEDYAPIMKNVREHAQRQGVEKWLDRVMSKES